MRPPCIRCGRPSKNDHHLTPRDKQGERLDPQLTAPLCRPCHDQEHNKLRVLDLDRAPGSLSVPERVEVFLRQAALFVAGLTPTWGPWCESLASALIRRADELADHTRNMDRLGSAWREAESMR